MDPGGVNLSGKTGAGIKMRSFYQRASISYDGGAFKENRDVSLLSRATPLPGDWDFVADRNQLQVRVSELAPPRFQTLCGFAGPSIQSNPSVGTQTPALLQIADQIDFNYGTSVFDTEPIFIFVRIDAYSSRSRLGGDFATLLPGAPVKGGLSLLEGVQIRPTLGAGPVWRFGMEGRTPRQISPRGRGVELIVEAVYILPRLRAKEPPPRFPESRLRVTFRRIARPPPFAKSDGFTKLMHPPSAPRPELSRLVIDVVRWL